GRTGLRRRRAEFWWGWSGLWWCGRGSGSVGRPGGDLTAEFILRFPRRGDRLIFLTDRRRGPAPQRCGARPDSEGISDGPDRPAPAHEGHGARQALRGDLRPEVR